MNIIVTGSLAFDQIMVFPDAFVDHMMPDKLHVMSVSFLVDKLHKNFGGISGNVSYNLGLLGKAPICLACAGKDAESYKVFLEKNGVDTTHFSIIKDDYTGSFVVITDKKDCQIAGFYPGAMRNDEDLSIKPIVSELESPAECFLFIGPTMPKAMAKHARDAKKLKVRYMYSPAQQIPRLSKEELIEGVRGAEILIGNDYELALVEKKTGMSKQEMLSQVSVLITTLGEKGSLIEKKDGGQIEVGIAKPRKFVDPTGSGDAYIAGFLSAYLDRKNLVECGQWAATAATYAVEEYGTTAHTFSKSLFETRLKENFG